MLTFYAPAIALANRLRYPYKFALISVLFILPLALVMFLLVSEIDRTTYFSRKEYDGVAYLRPVRALYEQVLHHRILMEDQLNQVGSPASGVRDPESRIEAVLVQVEQVDRQLGTDLQTTEHLRAVKERWADVKAKGLGPENPGTELHSQLIVAIRDLISQVGDTSNLILDPALDSYYLMDAILIKLPDSQDQLTQSRVIASRIAGRREVATGTAQLPIVLGLLRSNVTATERGLAVAFRENGITRRLVEPPLAEYAKAATTFATLTSGELARGAAGTGQPTLQLSPLQEAGRRALDQSFALWDESATELERVILIRVDTEVRKKAAVLAFALVVFGLIVYLIAGFYLSVMQTVRALEAAAQRMVGRNGTIDGDGSGRVKLDNRDELGQVVNSFNSIAVALVTASAHRQAVVDNAADGIITVDDRHVIQSFNPAAERIFGYPADAIIGQPFTLLLPAEPGQEHGDELLDHPLTPTAGRGDGAREVIGRRQDAGRFPMDLAVSEMRLDGERTLIAVVRDITERKRTEADLARARDLALEANRAKSAFLANMSHELRTPLNAIIGYSEMLQEEAEDLGQDEFVPDLSKIQAAGKHLLGLINDILDLSKIEAGKMDLYLETFDVAGFLSDVTSIVQPLVEKNANTLVVHKGADLGEMHADLTKVRQALFNLLSNATKFTEHGTIALRVDRESTPAGDWLTFAVTDTGIGMNEEQMSRLFQAFSQADASTTRKFGGTGLGLAISRRFCQMMGGDISVASEYGRGSTFTIRLPARVRELPAAPVSELHGTGLTAAGDLVLVIDDDPIARDLTERFLSAEGFAVATAAGGEEGLRLARELRPAVITLDVLMPGMDGWAVLSAIKADSELAEIPVIMLTFIDDKNLGYALGASEYLTKPIDRDRLVSVLRRYQHEKQSRRILVVDDDDATREMLRRMLEREGWTVSEAANGRLALEQIQSQPPGLILLDLMMPEMDGFDVVVALRQQDEWREIPVIVVTAKDLTAEDRLRLNGSVERVLQKGAYNRVHLLEEVRALVIASVTPPLAAAMGESSSKEP